MNQLSFGPARTRDVLAAVAHERRRQEEKHGPAPVDRPDGTGMEGLKVLRDWAQRQTDERAEAGTLTWLHILQEEYYEALAERGEIALEVELIQVAATAVSWVETIRERRESRHLQVVDGSPS